jgi:DNA-binding response OmpR family regulator
MFLDGHKLERWQVMQLIDPNEKGLLPANMEMRISSLRKKIKACGTSGESIRALRSFGYALTCTIQVL